MSHHDSEEHSKNLETVHNGNIYHEDCVGDSAPHESSIKDVVSESLNGYATNEAVSVDDSSYLHHDGDDTVCNNQPQFLHSKSNEDDLDDGHLTPPSPPPSRAVEFVEPAATILNESSPSTLPNDITSHPSPVFNSIFDSQELLHELQRLAQTQIESGVRTPSASQQLAVLLASRSGDQQEASPHSMNAVFDFNTKVPLRSPILQSWGPGVSASSPSSFPVTPSGSAKGFSLLASRGQLPTIAINDLRGDEVKEISEEERKLRCELAALYRLIDLHGWTTCGNNNQITTKIRGNNAILMSPVGVLYHEISASNLIRVPIDSNTLQHDGICHLVNKASCILHSTIHRARPDIVCAVHLHLPDVVAVSCMKSGLLPVSSEAEQLLTQVLSHPSNEEALDKQSRIRYHAYMGSLSDEARRERLLKDFGSEGEVLFLRNHGAIVCAESIEEAWRKSRLVVMACQAQMKLIRVGGIAAVNEAAMVSKAHLNDSNYKEAAQLEFEAMMRLLDKAGYRTGYHYQRPLLLQRMLGSLTDAAMEFIGGDESLLNSPWLSPAKYEYDAAHSEQNISKIRQQVAANRQKASQRSQWLSQNVRPSLTSPQNIISEEPEIMLEKIEAKNVQHSQKKDGKKHDKVATPKVEVPVVQVESVASENAPLRNPKNTQIEKSATFSGTHKSAIKDSSGVPSDFESTARTRKSEQLEVSDSEHHHKKGLKIAGIRIPSFSRKKK